MGEADAWFKRNTLSRNNLIEKTLNKIIEVGCGNGETLNYLSENLNCTPFGIEPSKKAVVSIKKKFKKINIKCGFADEINFNNEIFDYVHLGFFMYLVDRNLFLKVVSEIDRILKFGGYLSIVDFDPPFPYSNDYKHQKGVFSHKIDNSSVFVSTGFYSIVNKFSFSHEKFSFEKKIDERISLLLLYKENQIFKGTNLKAKK
jgi:SAM-dependent methyltransferase